MDENKSSVLPVIGAILLVSAFGVGGYFLGRYIDVKEMEKKSANQNQLSVETKPFSSSSLGVTFDYPETWSVIESSEGNISTITVTSENGSTFVYTKDSSVTEPKEYLCDSGDKTGEAEGTESCEFFSGSGYNFARFEDLTANSDGDILNIAELKGDELSNWYKYVPSDGFVIKIADADDIALMDMIMMTVVRTTAEE